MSQKPRTLAREQDPQESVQDESTPIIPRTEQDVKNLLNYHIENYLHFKEQAAVAAEPFHAKMTRSKIEIEVLLLELPEPKHEGDAGRAYFSERTVVRYDAKALDAVCQSFPEVEERIAPHRTEKVSKSLTVR